MRHNQLVIQTAFLGDLILSIPVLKRIKKLHPNTSLIVVCKKGLGDFLLTEKIADLVYEVEKNNRRSYAATIQKLNEHKIENIYCLHRSLRSLLMTAQIRAQNKVGFKSFPGFWVFDEMVDFIKEAPEVIRQFKILETVDEEVRLSLLDEDFEALHRVQTPIPNLFAFEKPQTRPSTEAVKKAAIFPGSVWSTKKWKPEGYAELARGLSARGVQVHLFGSADEVELCKEIQNAAPQAQVRAGTLSIAETLAQISDYDLVISNDSAPTHMAAYKGVPVITIFGPTTSQMGFRPWTAAARVIEKTDQKCRPCGPHGHHKCPLGHHECMTRISSRDVQAAAEELLGL